ncbi:MAG: lysozyme inhibitor LprI family protein [Pseudolabrys sp.]|jgi:uncharacterized protein YecT (DUF1311 family)
MRVALTLVAAAALTGAAASAAAPGQRCDGNTYEMVECLKMKTADWDKQLNAAYQAALKAADRKQAEQLRKAQRLWIKYRDANCLYYDLGEGTIARIEAGSCMLDMTRSRARELKRALEP